MLIEPQTKEARTCDGALGNIGTKELCAVT